MYHAIRIAQNKEKCVICIPHSSHDEITFVISERFLLREESYLSFRIQYIKVEQLLLVTTGILVFQFF